jgi:hypothetical protein
MDDHTIVRKCLREYARSLQKAGEIPARVTEDELNAELEKHVERIVQAFRSNTELYRHFQKEGPEHMEGAIRELIKQIL